MKIDLRNRSLFAGMLLLLFTSYRLAVHKSIVARNEYRELASRSDLTGDIPGQIAVLRQKETYLDSVLSKMDLGNTSVQNNLLRALNREAGKNGVRVMDFNEPHIFMGDGHLTSTCSFALRGGFGDILRTVHTLEQKGSFGKVVHLDLEKKKDFRTAESYLEAIVFVQRIQ